MTRKEVSPAWRTSSSKPRISWAGSLIATFSATAAVVSAAAPATLDTFSVRLSNRVLTSPTRDSAVFSNLRGTDLHGANLKKARLRQADLRGADLTDADLSGADLRKAKLKEARLDQAVLKDTRGL